jgi:hypothetical protein
VIQDKAGVDQRASDAELMALLRKAQDEIEAHGELNELNLLLHDFARELLKQRLLQMSGVPADDVVDSARIRAQPHN